MKTHSACADLTPVSRPIRQARGLLNPCQLDEKELQWPPSSRCPMLGGEQQHTLGGFSGTPKNSWESGMRWRKQAERKEERVPARYPVFLEHGRGVTRDVSPSGVFFETNAALDVGRPIKFAIDFDTAPGGPFRLLCEGMVARIENAHGRRGFGAAITSSRIRNL